MNKVAHNWFKLKKLLSEQGVDIQKPLFHACEISSALGIVSGGFKSKAGHGDANKKNAICFSRSLDFYNTKNFALDYIWEKQDAIFILEEHDVKARLKSKAYNWHYEAAPDFKKKLYTFNNKKLHEFEERITTGEFCSTETNIPPKYIKAIIVNSYLKYFKSIEKYTDVPILLYKDNTYINPKLIPYSDEDTFSDYVLSGGSNFSNLKFITNNIGVFFTKLPEEVLLKLPRNLLTRYSESMMHEYVFKNKSQHHRVLKIISDNIDPVQWGSFSNFVDIADFKPYINYKALDYILPERLLASFTDKEIYDNISKLNLNLVIHMESEGRKQLLTKLLQKFPPDQKMFEDAIKLDNITVLKHCIKNISNLEIPVTLIRHKRTLKELYDYLNTKNIADILENTYFSEVIIESLKDLKTDFTDSEFTRLLGKYIQKRDPHVVKMLLQAGIEINDDDLFFDLISENSKEGNKILKYLHKYGDLDAKKYLQYAIEKGNTFVEAMYE